MDRLRIALTCNVSPWSAYSGGGQQATHHLAEALVRAGHDVHVVYTAAPWERVRPDQPPRYWVHWATFFGWRAQRRSPLRPLNAVSVALTLRALHEEAPLDVVHANGEEGALLPLLPFRDRVRFVVTPRYPHYPNALMELRPLRRGLLHAWLWLAHTEYALFGRALRAADVVCATSRSGGRLVQRVFDVADERLRVIPNGVADDFLETRWTPPPSGAPLLFFGKLEDDKGVDTLLEALARLERPGLRAVVVGRGGAERRLREVARYHHLADRVRFVPWAAPRDLALRIAGARAVVLPSRFDVAGNTVAEAMAVGAPVVTTRTGSLPELVEPDRTGLLVPPDDPVALRDAIAALLDDPALAARLGAAARERVRDRSWDAVAARHEELYRAA